MRCACAQIVWLIAELVKLHVNDVDSLCTGIMRFVNTGDMPQKYLWLAQNLVTSFIGQRYARKRLEMMGRENERKRRRSTQWTNSHTTITIITTYNNVSDLGL